LHIDQAIRIESNLTTFPNPHCPKINAWILQNVVQNVVQKYPNLALEKCGTENHIFVLVNVTQY
jgi:hypothetical protein